MRRIQRPRAKAGACEVERTLSSNFDRNCQVCGIKILRCAHRKPARCFSCSAPQEGRDGWMESGWGRCPDCDGWIHKDHCYCLCGYANQQAIDKRKRQRDWMTGIRSAQASGGRRP